MFSPKNPNVRTVKFVGGTAQEIAIQRADIDQLMRRVVNGIDEDLPRLRMSHLAARGHVVDRAERVRSRADRDQLRPGVELLREIVPNRADPFPESSSPCAH